MEKIPQSGISDNSDLLNLVRLLLGELDDKAQSQPSFEGGGSEWLNGIMSGFKPPEGSLSDQMRGGGPILEALKSSNRYQQSSESNSSRF